MYKINLMNDKRVSEIVVNLLNKRALNEKIAEYLDVDWISEKYITEKRFDISIDRENDYKYLRIYGMLYIKDEYKENEEIVELVKETLNNVVIETIEELKKKEDCEIIYDLTITYEIVLSHNSIFIEIK